MIFKIDRGAKARTVGATLLLWSTALPYAYSGAGKTENPNNIEIVNNVDACLTFEQNDVQIVGLTTQFFLSGTLIAKTSHCGCMSRLLSYTVLETIINNDQPITYERTYGIFLAPAEVNDNKRFALTLKSDNDITYTGTIAVRISCKSPD